MVCVYIVGHSFVCSPDCEMGSFM